MGEAAQCQCQTRSPPQSHRLLTLLPRKAAAQPGLSWLLGAATPLACAPDPLCLWGHTAAFASASLGACVRISTLDQDVS